MKNSIFLPFIFLTYLCLLILSCDKEEFKGEEGIDLVQAQQELNTNINDDDDDDDDDNDASTAPIIVDEVLAPKNAQETTGLPTRPVKWTVGEVLYSNSFETEEEYGKVFVAGGEEVVSLTDWNNDMDRMGMGQIFISRDAPATGDTYSLLIEGHGCVVYDGPFYIFTKVGPFDEDKDVAVRFWAYDVSGGGFPGSDLKMKVADDTDNFYPYSADQKVKIDSEEWKLHETIRPLHIPAGKVLYIHPYAASGIAGATAIRIDLLEVISLVAN